MEDRLKKFAQLVDAGSFVQASQDLHLSQPALSMAIAKLERELHAPLLVHGMRPLRMTPAGKLAYATGKDLLVRANNLKALLAELAEQEVAVSLGMIDSVADALFSSPESIDELERHASVSLVVDNSTNLLQAVERGKVDLAFVVGRREYDKTFEVIHRAEETLAVVCHADQRAVVGGAMQKGVLPHFISYNQASTTYQLVADALHERRIVPETTFYSTSPEVMLRLVLLKKGVAALPYLQVRDYLAAGELALVSGREPLTIERPIHAVKRRDMLLPQPLTHTVRQVGGLFGAVQPEVS